MKINAQGVSEVVLEVSDMKRAVDFWSGQLGFPIVQQWGYQDGQFTVEANDIWATWLYVGGPTNLGLWLPRKFNEQELLQKASSVSLWNGLFDEGGIHVHLALYVGIDQIESAIQVLENHHIDRKIVIRGIHKRVYFKDTENNVIEFYTQSMEEDYLSRFHPI
ncbi:Catechol 2,3-dioxygenase [Paenibacillus sp. 1_12]|uniref:VOC family protein n=1 Tax=Paenibacillus sp. 1_12 TaxID=1566278 RepID=UPI0008E085D5|nr:VOC family protein [Paenibacillus sp. 1_12]SFL74828.1 Catechol 2,3-dioxygenase [Paenibacillus sp. 1_12]